MENYNAMTYCLSFRKEEKSSGFFFARCHNLAYKSNMDILLY